MQHLITNIMTVKQKASSRIFELADNKLKLLAAGFILLVLVIGVVFVLRPYLASNNYQPLTVEKIIPLTEEESIAQVYTDQGRYVLELVNAEDGQRISTLVNDNVIDFRLTGDKKHLIYTSARVGVNPSDIPKVSISELEVNTGVTRKILSDVDYQVVVSPGKTNEIFIYTTDSAAYLYKQGEKTKLLNYERSGNDSGVAFVPDVFWNSDFSTATLKVMASDYPSSKQVITYKIYLDSLTVEEISRGQEIPF